jgi:hypothetical protein
MIWMKQPSRQGIALFSAHGILAKHRFVEAFLLQNQACHQAAFLTLFSAGGSNGTVEHLKLGGHRANWSFAAQEVVHRK